MDDKLKREITNWLEFYRELGLRNSTVATRALLSRQDLSHHPPFLRLRRVTTLP